ncbi:MULTISPECIES: lipid IV(A) palmitoyltransferase PagP [unclassified Brenneria]|uniref:lipid IV(A) palmitoyltransferase PagP n=1 Tax=unclassified Brenneria TaxID=2634434 RepID=UPI0029C23D21|nr:MULTISPECIES: lipid IV(A) palmitoyltransferase PagP [unclassified Brenneria]MDX5629711.1 lipid IV(A) palmitoyltransferase PagP [Brenneria sp. L3-3Z]MDX5696857.1 lipid IV(A) palmitoyltransferase PagP [Brenneria sp. L4-2C]
MYLKRVIIILCLMASSAMPILAHATDAASAGSVVNKDSAAGHDESWWQRSKNNLSKTWSESPNHDIYIPAITWHNRWTYDKEKTDEYNERPWGAGYGVSRLDEDGDWHSLYLMAFKDSHNKWEPIGGYGFEKRWRPTRDQDFQLGLGFTAGVTMRDNWNYIPIPVLLPLASISYQKLSFQATYIPGTYNNGNVFFAWFRWQI